MKLIERCRVCNKILEIKFRSVDREFYTCGHSALFTDNGFKVTESLPEFDSIDGKLHAYEYQIAGYEFLRNSGFSALLGDGMGLGKTMQSLLALRNHPEQLLPALIIQKSATTSNWVREIRNWVENDFTAAFPILGKALFLPPGFKTYVISMDSLRRNMQNLQKLHSIQPFKTVIVDECHSFKEDGAQRTKALIEFLGQRLDTDKRDLSGNYIKGDYAIKQNPIPHRIFLSGTPIKNRADEFYVTLNLLRPKVFPFRQRFRYQYLRQNAKGAWAEFSSYRKNEFDNVTKSFILRRDKTQVLKDLPAFSRHFEYITIEDEQIKHVYNQQIDLMSNMEAQKTMSTMALLGWLAKMRHITGMAKIRAGYDFASEFFENTQMEKMIDPSYPDKLAIGIHHKGVREELINMFNMADENCDETIGKFKALSLSGEDNAIKKSQIVDSFNLDSTRRVLVANELAGGIGLNLQSCANVLCLERQWSSADEEQFEARFWRNGQKYPVTATYLLVDRSIDMFFHQIVEEKRRIFGDTFNLENDPDSVRELVKQVLDNKL